MQFENNPLEELAERVRCGDPGAAEEFRGEMSLALEGMVRLALRKVACFNPFEEYARAEADRLRESSDWQPPGHELARRTAGQVCQDMIVRLKAGGRIQDTFACLDAGRSSLKDQTVLAACSLSLASRVRRLHGTPLAALRSAFSPAALKEKCPL